MNYKLDSIPITNYGAHPTLAGQALSLHGMLDLPKRIGMTEYNWGTSIEPFVDPEDIELDGRTLNLYVAIKKINLDAFKAACAACTELSFDLDTFSVIQKDEIKVDEIGEYCTVSIPFWQNEIELKPVNIVPSGTGTYMLDSYDLNKDFGIYIGKSGNVLNTAGRIDVQTTELYRKTEYRGGWNIELQCSMVGSDFLDVYNKMNQFQAVLMGAGSHSLTVKNNSFRVYFKDGISVRIMADNILQFSLRIRGIGLRELLRLLASEDGELIITEDGYCIDLKY